MAELLGQGGYYSPSLLLRRIVMVTCPHLDSDGGFTPSLFVEEGDGKVALSARSRARLRARARANTQTRARKHANTRAQTRKHANTRTAHRIRTQAHAAHGTNTHMCSCAH